MKVAVLLSGGVDSSVALHLVQKEGKHEITAFYLKIWLEEELAFLGDCPWEEDLKYAREVCEQAGIPLKVMALQTEYQERIVGYVVSELKAGRTPSPDILCNQWIKFGLFFEKIDPGYEKVVSGHYAQVEERGGDYLLKRSPDPVKDQTYFLSRLSQEQLRRLWFPIGHLHKHEVRVIAERLELPNRTRPDSQGICFLGKIKYPEFVRFHLGEKEGEIQDVDSGKVVGKHKGTWFHTVGQRKGLGLGGGPWYVVKKDLEKNVVYVSHSDRYLEHAKRQFVVADVHWIAGKPPGPGESGSIELMAKVRHSPKMEKCRVRELGGGRWEVALANKDQGIAPGQSAIFYEGEYCLGGGVIE